MQSIPPCTIDGTILDHTGSVLDHIDQHFPTSLDRLFELLRFPSVATDPAHDPDCLKAARWLVRDLESMGFEAGLRQTTGQPVVVGRYVPPGGGEGKPHILFYGHYDVQPADPLDLWASDPFDPVIRKMENGKEAIFARGACDDKGQLMTFLEASRSWLAVHGSLPFRLTVMIEGDEEGDTTHLDLFLKMNAKEFAVDAAFICDTEMWDEKTPAINTRLRGCIGDEVTISGPRIDLHSGYYGGPAVNPIKVLSRILGELHDRRAASPSPASMAA